MYVLWVKLETLSLIKSTFVFHFQVFNKSRVSARTEQLLKSYAGHCEIFNICVKDIF